MKKLFAYCFVIFSIFSCTKENDITPTANKIVLPTDEFHYYHETADTSYRIKGIIQLKDSSYILYGGMSLDDPFKAPYREFQNIIMKLDKYGQRVWQRRSGAANSPNGLDKLYITSNNNFIGFRHPFINDSPILFEFDSLGKSLSEKIISTTTKSVDIIRDDHGYLIVGGGQPTFHKISFSGNIEWTKKYSFIMNPSSVSQFSDKSFALIGFGGSNYRNCLMKLDQNADSLWSKKYIGYKVQALPDNNILAIINGPDNMLKFIRLDTQGEELWRVGAGYIERASANYTNLNIIRFDDDNYVFSARELTSNDNSLYLYLISGSGEVKRRIQIKLSIPWHFFALTRTLDNGILVVKSESIYKTSLDFIKLPDINSWK